MMPGQFDRNELEKLSRREPEAIERWFRRYADEVFTFVYHKVGRDSELARDVVQDTFLDGIAKITRYEPKKASMSVWLLLLSRNHIKKALRARKRVFSDACIDVQNHEYRNYCRNLSSELIPTDVIQTKEVGELVRAALSDIPASYGEALRMHYYSGDSIRKIADFKQITEGAAKVLLHRARKSFGSAFVKLAGNSDFKDLKVR